MEPKRVYLLLRNEVLIDTWQISFLSNDSIGSSLQLPIVVRRAQNEEIYAVVPQNCVLFEGSGWMLRVFFSEILPTIRHHREIGPIKRYDISMNWSTCNAHEIIIYNNAEFGRTVAISLNPLFVEFRRKMRKSHSQDESSPRFREESPEWANDVTSHYRTILSDGLVISAQNYRRSRNDNSSWSFRQRFSRLWRASRLFAERARVYFGRNRKWHPRNGWS